MGCKPVPVGAAETRCSLAQGCVCSCHAFLHSELCGFIRMSAWRGNLKARDNLEYLGIRKDNIKTDLKQNENLWIGFM
jgi:hypothetical protein